MQFEQMTEKPSRRSPWINLLAAFFIFGGMLGMSRGIALVLTPAQLEPLLAKLDEAAQKTQYMPLNEAEREHLAFLFSQTAIQMRSSYGLDSESGSPDPYFRICLQLSVFLSVLSIMAGNNLKKRKEWARKLALIQVFLSFPLSLRSLSMEYVKNLNSDRVQNLLIQLHLFDENSVPGLRELATIQMGICLFAAVFWLIAVVWLFTRPSIREEFKRREWKPFHKA